ncbi:hypothetical protein SAMN05443549_10675 [Flavobacterium fluvii]|uniref:Uncharacterized protein n=1 Tax=Flavobacterium fluvii TaxID=468056 RepID=A0A1M5M8H9_9FLAO|nr:hypothetical protein SAMN05443549_10675 [Flavobacterium fluvii]
MAFGEVKIKEILPKLIMKVMNNQKKWTSRYSVIIENQSLQTKQQQTDFKIKNSFKKQIII